jgi:mannose-6-phosphate isomerase-like protein (cupin superfamily)
MQSADLNAEDAMRDGLPTCFRLGEGKSYQLGRIILTFKTSSIDTASAYTLCEAIEPPQAGAGLHRHSTYDETHIICEGRYEARLGDATLQLSAGDMFFAPRGTPHSIKCLGPETGRELMISSPGGVFDAFIDEVARSMTNSGTPSSGAGVDFRAIAREYGIEFLE